MTIKKVLRFRKQGSLLYVCCFPTRNVKLLTYNGLFRVTRADKNVQLSRPRDNRKPSFELSHCCAWISFMWVALHFLCIVIDNGFLTPSKERWKVRDNRKTSEKAKKFQTSWCGNFNSVFIWGILGRYLAEFPVSLSNHAGFTPRLLNSSTLLRKFNLSED